VSNIETIIVLSCTLKPYKNRKEFGMIWTTCRSQNSRRITFTMLIKLKPLFVVQGANDVRVTIKEADQIVAALRKKNLCSLHGEIR
jgi:hypothetical protein